MKTEEIFEQELSLEELMSVKGGANGNDDKDKPIIICTAGSAITCNGAPAI